MDESVTALRHILQPHSVAVVGASRRRGTIGGEVFHNAVTSGFAGPVFPVNVSAGSVQSVAAYRSVLDIPETPDLAVIAVPASGVCQAARECAAKGVKALVVISAGFAEVGPEGAARQAQLLRICREAGMRLVGPNCMGVLNPLPGVRLNATFIPKLPDPGSVAFMSQSGALGLAVIEYARRAGLGLSSFVSAGNKADVSGNDLLEWWEWDPETSVIMLYLESFGNPRKFAQIARRVARSKPIVALKSGRSPAGARAGSSHTGALLAGSDVTVDALFRQSGVIRCDTVSDMFDVASLLAHQPLPRGDRVAIVSNGGGPGILCADACEAAGLRVEALPAALQDRLKMLVPQAAALANPVDLLASASADDYGRTMELLGGSDAVDALIVIFVAPMVTLPAEVAEQVQKAAGHLAARTPVLAVNMSGPLPFPGTGVRVPSYDFPEDAARALGHTVRYSRWRSAGAGSVPAFDGLQTEKASRLLAGARVPPDGWLEASDVAELLACYGIPAAETRLASSPAGAGAAAAAIGGPVALKASAAGLIHKTDVGAVALSLQTPADVEKAAIRMADHLKARGFYLDGFVLQPMAGDGVQMLVGMVSDPLFGPVVACGAGGTTAELLKDVAIAICPMTDKDAHDMVRSLATFPLLDGYRGAPKAAVGALEEVVLRLSALAGEHPEIAELDLNPVIVSPGGAIAVDFRARMAR